MKVKNYWIIPAHLSLLFVLLIGVHRFSNASSPEEAFPTSEEILDEAQNEDNPRTNINHSDEEQASGTMIKPASVDAGNGVILTVDAGYEINSNNIGINPEYAIFNAIVENSSSGLVELTLDYTFIGDYNSAAIEVYGINSNGSTSLLTENIDYTISNGMITFNDPSRSYRVRAKLSATKSILDAVVDPNEIDFQDALTIKGEFRVSTKDSLNIVHTATEAKSVQPIAADGNNGLLNKGNILTDVTVYLTENQLVIMNYWSLIASDLVDTGGSPLEELSLHAGDYFVFRVDPNFVHLLLNDDEGPLIDSTTGITIGYFYMDSSTGSVVLIFNDNVEKRDNIWGHVRIETDYQKEQGQIGDYNAETNTGTIPIQVDKVKLDVSKTGTFTDQHRTEINWSVIVNEQNNKVQNLSISDSEASGKEKGSGYDNWRFTGEPEVYIWENDEWALLTKGQDYKVISSNDSGSLKYTVNIFGDDEGYTTSKYKLDYPAKTNNTSTINVSYYNLVIAEADNAKEPVEADTVIIRKSATMRKWYQEFNSDASTAEWYISYNYNGKTTGETSIYYDSVEITDDVTGCYWRNSNGTNIRDLTYDFQNIRVYLGGTENGRPIPTGTLLTLDQDYYIDYTYTEGKITGFQIKFYDNYITTGNTGYITDCIFIYYDIELDLNNPPEDAMGWYIRNDAFDYYNSSSPNTASANLIQKAYKFDYSNRYCHWTIAFNDVGIDMKDGTEIYDILPYGFSMAYDSLDYHGSGGSQTFYVLNNKTKCYVPVIDKADEASWTSANSSLAKGGYFTYQVTDLDEVNTKITTTKPMGDTGFKLIFHPGTKHGSTDAFQLTYRTSVNFDETKIDTNGKATDYNYASTSNKNYALLWYKDENSDYTIKSETEATMSINYTKNSYKEGTYSQMPTDVFGNYVAPKIEWVVKGNYFNANLNNAVFTDELLSGLDAENNSVAFSGQIIKKSDIAIYSLNVNPNGTMSINELVNLEHYGAVIAIENSTQGNPVIKITFPSDFDTRLKNGGITISDKDESNMRFAVVFTTRVGEGEDVAAYHYPNEAILVKEDGSIDKCKEDVYNNVVTNSSEKTSELDISNNRLIHYKAVFNKDQQKLQNLLITDKLAYTENSEQILYLDESSIKIYEAVVHADGSYGEGKMLYRYTDWQLVYDQTAKKGFQIAFNSFYSLEKVPLIIEYSCYYNHVETGTKITNTIGLEGQNTVSESRTIGYTTASGGATSSLANFAVRKVDENGNVLDGAKFTLYDGDQLYAVYKDQETVNGVAEFTDLIAGKYYLYESEAPAGYQAVHNSLANAMHIMVRYGRDSSGQEIVCVDLLDADGSVQIDSNNLAEIVVMNTLNTGSLKVKKCNAADNTEVLADAVFRVYELGINGTKRYHYGLDGNGIAAFTDDQTKTPTEFRSNSNGEIYISDLPLGTYYLEEIEAPPGYVIPDDPIEITLDESNKDITYEVMNEPEKDSIAFVKYNGDQSTALEGAEFSFYKCTATEENHLHTSLEDENTCWTFIESKVSSATGAFVFENLTDGIYLLTETKAPNGYELPKGNWVIKFNVKDGVTDITADSNEILAIVKHEKEDDTIEYRVLNQKPFELPLAGSIALSCLLVLGGAALLTAGSVILLNQKRKRNNKV